MKAGVRPLDHIVPFTITNRAFTDTGYHWYVAFDQAADGTALAASDRRAGRAWSQSDAVGHQRGGGALRSQITGEVGHTHQGRKALGDGTGRVGIALRVADDLMVVNGAEVHFDAFNLAADCRAAQCQESARRG